MTKPVLPPELAAEVSPATLLVRGGATRSAYDETCEALYLTSGFVYGSAAEAEAAFKNDGSRFVYSRYGNPTVTMFEERLRLLEGAEACRATASGMAAVFAALLCQVRAGDRVVASRAPVRLLPLHRQRPAAALWRRDRAGRRHRPVTWETALARGRPLSFCESPSNPAMEIIDLPRWRGSHTAPAASSWSTMCSRRRCCRGRWRSAPTSSCIRPPSTSTARAAGLAARCSASEKFIKETSAVLSPHRPVAPARSTPGSC